MAEQDEMDDEYDEDKGEIVNLLNCFQDVHVPYLNQSFQKEQSVFAQSLKILFAVANLGDYREELRKFTLSKEFSDVPFFKKRSMILDLLELPEWEGDDAAQEAALIHFSRQYNIIMKVETENDMHLEFWSGGRRRHRSREFKNFEVFRDWMVRKRHNPYDKHTLVFNLRKHASSKSVLCHAFLRLDFYVKYLFMKVEDSCSRKDENSNYRRYYLELFQFVFDRLESIRKTAGDVLSEGITAVFLLGVTGVGKSCILNLLNDTSEFTVGNDALNSQTFFPQALGKGDQLLFDLPGIKDTRDPEIALLNSIILSSLYRSFDRSVSVLTFDYNAFKFSGRGNEIRDVHNFVNQFFVCTEGYSVSGIKSIQIPENIKNTIVIVINRFDGNEDGLKDIQSKLKEIFGIDESRMIAILDDGGDSQKIDKSQIPKLASMIRKLAAESSSMNEDSYEQAQLAHEASFQVVLLDEFKHIVPEYSKYVLKTMLEEAPDTIVQWHGVLKDLYSLCQFANWAKVEGKLIETAVEMIEKNEELRNSLFRINGVKAALDSRESVETKQNRLAMTENLQKECVKQENQVKKEMIRQGQRNRQQNTEKLKQLQTRKKELALEIEQIKNDLNRVQEVKKGRETAEDWVKETVRSIKATDEVVMRYSGHRYTVLHVIAQYNFFNLMDEIQALVGIDLLEKLLYDDDTEGKQTPLHVAVSYGSSTVFKQRKDSRQNSVLHLAAQERQVDIISDIFLALSHERWAERRRRLCLKTGGSGNKYFPLHMLCVRDCTSVEDKTRMDQCMEILLRHANFTSDWWKEDPNAKTLLKFACEKFSDYFLERLFHYLEKLSTFDSKVIPLMVNYNDLGGKLAGNCKEYTPLYWLFRKRNPDSNEVESARNIVNLLVDHGADPSVTARKDKTTILSLAVKNKYLTNIEAELLTRRIRKTSRKEQRATEEQHVGRRVSKRT
eukprot:768458-Hanusia_phi.AAC.1